MAIYVLQLLGVAVSAVSGALAAGRKHLDLLGVIVVGVVNAVGGGTLRDVLLDRHPVFWIERPTYLYVTLGSTLLTVVHAKFFKPPYRALLVADAFGLALFSISGAQIAEQVELSNLLIVVMGTMTGTAGGLLRDVLLADIPVIFTRSRIYATAAIVGITAYLLLQAIGLLQTWAALISMTIIVSLRLAAIIWGLMLPIFSLSDAPPHD
ncbi:MAG: trimeric intracellular cation channel family protein [Cyanobacteria bacterium P01_H01_bin.21]